MKVGVEGYYHRTGPGASQCLKALLGDTINRLHFWLDFEFDIE